MQCGSGHYLEEEDEEDDARGEEPMISKLLLLGIDWCVFSGLTLIISNQGERQAIYLESICISELSESETEIVSKNDKNVT